LQYLIDSGSIEIRYDTVQVLYRTVPKDGTVRYVWYDIFFPFFFQFARGYSRWSAAARNFPPLSPSPLYPASDRPSHLHHMSYLFIYFSFFLAVIYFLTLRILLISLPPPKAILTSVLQKTSTSRVKTMSSPKSSACLRP